MIRLRRIVETLRRLGAEHGGPGLPRAWTGRGGPRRGRVVPSPTALAPLPTASRRPTRDPYDRPEGDAWRLAGVLVRAVAADGSLLVDGEPRALALAHAAAAGPVRALAEAGDLPGARAWLATAAQAPATAHLRAHRVLALVEARCAGLLEADAWLLRDLELLAHRPPWEERGLALACTGAALHRGGAAFSGAVARGWRARGASILSTCAAHQALPDGTHVGRSPVTHALFLELLLVALSTCKGLREAPPRGVEAAAARLASTLPALLLSDGEPPRARDGAPGEALPLPALLAWAETLLGPAPRGERLRARRFPSAGLAILSAPDGAHSATLWAAPPRPPDDTMRPPDADALAMEVVLSGVRLIASAGSTGAGGRAGQDRDRRPGAFAGVLVDGVALGDPSGKAATGGGWARRLEVPAGSDVACAEAYAGGLVGPARGVVLRRVVHLGAGPCVVVIDEATGEGEHELAYAWPLAPGLSARVGPDGARIDGLGRTFAFAAAAMALSVEDGLFARGPGLGVRREVLWTRTRRLLPVRIVHALAPGEGPLRVSATPIPGGELRIEVEGPFGRAVAFVPLGRRP